VSRLLENIEKTKNGISLSATDLDFSTRGYDAISVTLATQQIEHQTDLDFIISSEGEEAVATLWRSAIC